MDLTNELIVISEYGCIHCIVISQIIESQNWQLNIPYDIVNSRFVMEYGPSDMSLKLYFMY